MTVEGSGEVADGPWLVTQFERSLFSPAATITAKKPIKKLPEPAPEVVQNSNTVTDPSKGDAGGGSGGKGQDSLPSGTTAGAARALAAAVSQNGTREQGSNGGPAVQKYAASIGGSAGQAWCGYFVAWAARQGGANADSRWAYVPNLNSGSASGVRGTTTDVSRARPGDLLTMNNVGHVMMIAKYNGGGVFHCIGGNTSDMVKYLDVGRGQWNRIVLVDYP